MKKEKRLEWVNSLEDGLIKLYSAYALTPQRQNVHSIFISVVKNIIMYQHLPSFFIHCSYFYPMGMQKMF